MSGHFKVNFFKHEFLKIYVKFTDNILGARHSNKTQKTTFFPLSNYNIISTLSLLHALQLNFISAQVKPWNFKNVCKICLKFLGARHFNKINNLHFASF